MKTSHSFIPIHSVNISWSVLCVESYRIARNYVLKDLRAQWGMEAAGMNNNNRSLSAVRNREKALWEMGCLERARKDGSGQSLIGRDHFMQALKKKLGLVLEWKTFQAEKLMLARRQENGKHVWGTMQFSLAETKVWQKKKKSGWNCALGGRLK